MAEHRRGGRRPGTAVLRELNERAVFDALARSPQSRSQLAAGTGLSKPTVSAALAHLVRTGLARQEGHAPGSSGPAAELFALDPTAGFVVGIQVHGRVQVAVADLAGRVLARQASPARIRAAQPLAAAVAALAADATRTAGVDPARLAAVVVAVPGVPDPATRSVQRTTIPALGRTGFLDDLDRAVGAECLVVNDVNLAAVGEHRWGAAAGVSDFALVSLRPGLGLSAFVGGRLHTGVHGAAGEVAMLPVIVQHDLGRLVQRAARHPGEQLMLDEAASTSGLVRLAHRLGLTAARTAPQVYRAARDGDRTARKAVRIHARQLALTVAAAAAILDPELVVISGYLDDRVAAHVSDVLKAVDATESGVVAGHLGEDAVLLGAVAAGLPRAHERVFARAAAGR
jgi:predicted NBD/HSP70 family sugar kinase